MARLPLQGADRSDRGGADLEFRHGRRGRPHRPGRRQSRIAGAALLPIVDLNGSGDRSRRLADHQRQPSSVGGRRQLADARNYSASLSASYEIDFWGKNRAALRAAEELAVASRFDREVVALTTVVSVANSYFLVLAAQDRLRIARNNLEAATRVYNLIKQRFDVGTASALDIAQQESVVSPAARFDPAAGAASCGRTSRRSRC